MSVEKSLVLEFAGFRLDPSRKVLWHGAEPVQLASKEVEILTVLVGRAGQVVTKNELLDLIWNDCFVNENNVPRHVYLIRKMFRDHGETADLIQTVPRRGYRFTGDARTVVENEKCVGSGAAEWKTRVATRHPRQLGRAASLSAAVVAFMMIAVLLGWRVSGSNAAIRENADSPDSSAAELYEKGRLEWQKRDRQSMINAERLFRGAIERDPNFAPAYVGLADRVMMQHDPTEARNLVARALEIDPRSAPAYASRGFLAMFHDWNWKDAESDFRKSIELAPDYGPAHHWYAILLEITERDDEARAEFEAAMRIAPRSANYLADFGQFLYFARDFGGAETACRKALEIEPEFSFANEHLGEVYFQIGDFENGIKSRFRSSAKATFADSTPASLREDFDSKVEAHLKKFRADGVRSYFEAVLDASEKGDPVWLYGSAKISARMLDRERTLLYLERSYEARNRFSLPFVNREPAFDFVRDDPRFKAIVAKMSL